MFRDPEQFKLLEEVLLPRLLAGGTRLSVWSAGCSDGTELHTLGLVLARLGVLDRTVLLGSDLLEENLALARAGDYPAEVRARMRWERRDLAADGPPPGRWRLVLCRNVAIYLSPGPAGALRDAGSGAGDARHPAARPQRAAARPGVVRAASGRAPRVPAGGMRRRLTVSHARRLGADHRRRRGRARRAGGGHRPPARRRRARPPLTGRDRDREPDRPAAAGGPDHAPRLPDPRQPEGARRLPRGAASRCPPRRSSSQASSADNPAQPRRAQEIRRQAARLRRRPTPIR